MSVESPVLPLTVRDEIALRLLQGHVASFGLPSFLTQRDSAIFDAFELADAFLAAKARE